MDATASPLAALTLTLADVARRLEVTKESVRIWVTTGLGGHVLPGAKDTNGAWRIDLADLEDWLANHAPAKYRGHKNEIH